MIVNTHEAKTHLSRLLDRVRRGEEIVIAKSGKPCARLCPLRSGKPRKPGLLKGKLDKSFFDPLSDEELNAWEK